MNTTTPAPSRPERKRRTRKLPVWVHVARLLVAVTIVLGWEIAARTGVVDEFFTSRPSAIAGSWWDLAESGALKSNLMVTLQAYLLGFAIGAVAALLLGYVVGSSRALAMVVEPFITAFYSIPKLALIPLFVMWFGVGRQLEVVICALVVFLLMFFNTYYGVRDVDQGLVDAMRLLGAGRWAIALRVQMPSALVWVVAGLKISVPQGLMAIVVAEMLFSNAGLGYLVASSAGQFDADGTFAAILNLLIIGLIIDRVVALITRRALVWKQDARAA